MIFWMGFFVLALAFLVGFFCGLLLVGWLVFFCLVVVSVVVLWASFCFIILLFCFNLTGLHCSISSLICLSTSALLALPLKLLFKEQKLISDFIFVILQVLGWDFCFLLFFVWV